MSARAEVAARPRAPVLDLRLGPAIAYWHRNAAVYRRTWLFGMIAWFLEPLLYLVAMGFGLGRYLESIQGIDYIDYIAPGLLGVAAMYGATFESTWNVFTKIDRLGVYDAASSAPLSIADIAIGEIMWSTTRATIHGAAFAIVATLFGVFSSYWGLLVLPGLALIGVAFSIIGLTYTYLSKRIDYLAYYWTLFVTPAFLFSGTFFPLDRLPDWVRAIAWCTPLYHGVNMMRALVRDGDPLAALGSAGWLIALSLAMLWMPLMTLRRRLGR